MNSVNWRISHAFQHPARLCLLIGLSAMLTIVGNETRAQPPTGKEVIQSFVQATGGETNLRKIKSLRIRGSKVSVNSGMKSEMEMLLSEEGFRRSESIPFVGIFASGREGNECWRFRPPDRLQYLDKDEAAAFVVATRIHEQLHWLDDNEVKCEGESVVNDRPAWHLSFKDSSGETRQRYFDKETGLLIKEVNEIAETPFTTYYSDYREVDGIKLAHKAETQREDGQIEWVLTYTDVKSNVEITEKSFSPPSEMETDRVD